VTSGGPPSVRLVGAILAAVSLFALVLAVYAAVQFREFAECQAQYSENLNERTRILTDVGAAEREAERRRSDALDATFLDPALSKPAGERTEAETERIRQLFAKYLDAAEGLRAERALADRARAANPVPPPPSAVCGA
jgi:hypothetical protein